MNIEDQNSWMELQLFKRQFLQLVEPQNLAVPDGKILKSSSAQQFLYENLFQVAPGDELDFDTLLSYKTRVLKTVLARIENAITDYEEDVRYVSTIISLFLGSLGALGFLPRNIC